MRAIHLLYQNGQSDDRDRAEYGARERPGVRAALDLAELDRAAEHRALELEVEHPRARERDRSEREPHAEDVVPRRVYQHTHTHCKQHATAQSAYHRAHIMRTSAHVGEVGPLEPARVDVARLGQDEARHEREHDNADADHGREHSQPHHERGGRWRERGRRRHHPAGRQTDSYGAVLDARKCALRRYLSNGALAGQRNCALRADALKRQGSGQ